MKKILILSLFIISQAFYTQNIENESVTSYRATAEIKNKLEHTKLKVSFDFKKEYLYGEEWLTASPYFYSQSTIELDAKAMEIISVQLNNQNLKYNYANYKLTIFLDKTYKKDEKFTIYIKYIAKPNEVKQKGSWAIAQAKGLYFINPRGEEVGKPTQIWTQGETESSSCWFPTIDKPNQKTSQEIYITVPDKFVTLSNGELKTQTKNADATRTDYWKFDQKHAPYLFFMGIGEYAIVKDKWRNIEVNYYVEKPYESVAKDIFGLTPEMIEFYSQKLNYPFPWNKYSQIFARDYVSGAMENTTAVIHGDFFQKKKGFLVDENTGEYVIAHELFHHWFGDLVTTESWSNLTVNESFANYSEYLWFEHKYGKEEAEAHRFNENFSYLNGNNFDKELVRFHYASREDMFDNVSYNKGGAILHMMRNFLGDDAFFAGLNKYLKENEYKSAEAQQLRIALEQVSGKDLNWFFNQWYYNNGHPKLKISSEYSANKKEIKYTIIQNANKLFQFPFAVDIVENNKTTRQNIWVNAAAESTFIFPCESNPEVIIANADQVLLCEINENKPTQEYIKQYEKSMEYITKIEALNHLLENQKDTEAQKTILKSLDDKFYRIRLNVLSRLDIFSDVNWKNSLTPKLIALAKNDEKTLVQAQALVLLNKLNPENLKEICTEKINSPSYSVQAQAIIGLLKSDKSLAEKHLEQLDEDAYTDELLFLKIDNWIDTNQKEKATKLAEIAAFYPFTQMENQANGQKAQKAFRWIMEQGFPTANTHIVTMYTQIKKQYADNAYVLSTLNKVIQEGIDLKKKKISENVFQKEQLQQQVEELQEALKN